MHKAESSISWSANMNALQRHNRQRPQPDVKEKGQLPLPF
jgi:hypothetical protein